MKNKDLSICIIGKDQSDLLKRCIEYGQKLTDRISYVDLKSEDNSFKVASSLGVYSVIPNETYQNIPEKLIEFHKSKWILFLRPDEKIVFKSKQQIKRALNKSKATGYSLVIKTPMQPELLDDYRWIKIKGKRNRYSPESLIVPRIEIRIVRQPFFLTALRHMISGSEDTIYPFESTISKDLKIDSLQPSGMEEDNQTNLSRDLQAKYLKGEVSITADDDYGMWELGDDWIIYSVLTKDDLSRYYRGMAMGFGSERMYLTMLHNLGKYGRFNEARNFFEVWQEKWGTFDTPEPYRIGGIIYANLFQWKKSSSLLTKYLKMIPEEMAGEAHSLLAKTLLLQDMKDEAVAHLSRSLRLRADAFDAILLETIEKSSWKLPKLTVCMIAKDEQTYIASALESVTGIADEIILVDTGSQDKTKDIARKYNAKIIEVVWNDDFSKARNQGLRHATGDYILCLDADEFIDPRERIKLALLKVILPSNKDIAYKIKIETAYEDEEMSVMLRLPKLVQPDFPVRLFPAQKGICYDGAAFESVDNSVIAQGLTIEITDIFKITHSDTDRIFREKRKETSIQKLNEADSDPNIALKTMLYHIKLGNINAASEWLESACIDNPRLLMKITTLFCRLRKTKQVSGLLKNLLQKYPDSPELLLATAELHFADGDYTAVYHTLHPNLERIDKFIGREDRANAIYLYGMALLEIDYLENGISFLADARELDSWNLRYKVGGMFALTVAEQWEQAIVALSEILREEKVSFEETIDDFADLGILFAKLALHFEVNDRMEEADLSRRIFLNILNNKISDPAAIQKMTLFLDNSQSNLKGEYAA